MALAEYSRSSPEGNRGQRASCRARDLREQVMGKHWNRAATNRKSPRWQNRRAGDVRGCFGLSSGLEYDIGLSAKTEELIELSRVAHGLPAFT